MCPCGPLPSRFTGSRVRSALMNSTSAGPTCSCEGTTIGSLNQVSRGGWPTHGVHTGTVAFNGIDLLKLVAMFVKLSKRTTPRTPHRCATPSPLIQIHTPPCARPRGESVTTLAHIKGLADVVACSPRACCLARRARDGAAAGSPAAGSPDVRHGAKGRPGRHGLPHVDLPSGG